MRDAPPAPDWSDFAALVRAAVVAFGEPLQVWEERVMERGDARVLRRWLAALEGVARALLLALALRLGAGDVAGRTRLSRKGGPEDPAPGRAASIDPAKDDEPAASGRWAGVAFNALPRRARASGARSSPAKRRFVSTPRLAFRLEALIRVAAEPERFARRLARRLAAGSLAPAAAAARMLAGPTSPRAPGFARTILDDARRHARAALAAHHADTS